MAQHFTCYSAVFPLLLRERDGRREILLHHLRNGGDVTPFIRTYDLEHICTARTARGKTLR